MKLLKKNKIKNNLNTELKEMGVFSAVAGNQPKSIAKKSTTGSLPPAVPLAITPTFSPWSHTSDDSYIYQLSLVLATATVSFRADRDRCIGWRPLRQMAQAALLAISRSASLEKNSMNVRSPAVERAAKIKTRVTLIPFITTDGTSDVVQLIVKLLWSSILLFPKQSAGDMDGEA